MSDIDIKDRSSQVEDVNTVEKGGLARTSWKGVAFTEQDGKSARRRVDFVLVATLTLYYFMSYLDRSNLGNAKVAGIEKDLNMKGNDYNIAISVYFVPYILLEYPATIMLKRAGPDRMLPLLVGLWGIVTMCQGFIKSYSSLLVCRFFLGALESGLTPCSVVLMSMYVRRFDLQKRIAVFFAMISLAGAFAGLLAYAITKDLSGKHGYEGWRWIFLIEGGATIGVALATCWILPRSPATAFWLSAPQRAALLAGLQDDNTAYIEAKDETGLLKGFNAILTNPVVPVYLFLNAATGFFTNGLPYYIPPIIKVFKLNSTCSNGIGLASVWAFRASEAPSYYAGSCLGLTSAVLLCVTPPVAALNLLRINRKRDREMESLDAGHVHVEGVIDDRDVRFRFSY
ncbi:hypothetical protein RQP46_005468 [Phenoliferia psychrophenolica]